MATAVQQPGARSARRVPSARFTPRNALEPLGLLGALAGTWKGHGFNLIARPDFHDNTDLYLQLNHTRETLTFTPIGGPVPNRGFGQDDIELFGLTYLQQISDADLDGALHIEPGIWVRQPNTTFPRRVCPIHSNWLREWRRSLTATRCGGRDCRAVQRPSGADDPGGSVQLLEISVIQQHSFWRAANRTRDPHQCSRIVGRAHRADSTRDAVPTIRPQHPDWRNSTRPTQPALHPQYQNAL